MCSYLQKDSNKVVTLFLVHITPIKFFDDAIASHQKFLSLKQILPSETLLFHIAAFSPSITQNKLQERNI